MVFTTYKNSILATLISWAGTLIVGIAVMTGFAMSDIISVLPAVAIGGLMMFLAKKISEWKANRKK